MKITVDLLKTPKYNRPIIIRMVLNHMATKSLPVPTAKNSITQNGKTIYLTNKELLAELVRCREKDEMSPALAKMLQLLCLKYSKKGNFVGYCVDDSTQALTKRGWIDGGELTTNDMILSYDTKTSTTEWSKVHSVYREHYKGPMHHLVTPTMDLFATPNHKIVIGSNKIIPIEELKHTDTIVVAASPSNKSVRETYTTWFVQLVTYCAMYGVFYRNSLTSESASISFLVPESVTAQLLNVLQMTTAKVEINAPIKEGDHHEVMASGSVIESLVKLMNADYIIPASFISLLTIDQQLSMLRVCATAANFPSNISWVRSTANNNAMQMLKAITGRSDGVSRDGMFGHAIAHKEVIHCEIEFLSAVDEKSGPVATCEYDGIVWCPETEYGTFVCRRNKKVFITGNSYNEDMQAFAMMMLVRTWNRFDPAKSDNPFAFFTQCIKNSFIQFLNQESNQRKIRDSMMISVGLNPSFGYVDDSGADKIQDESEYDTMKQTLDEHAKYVFTDAPIERDDKGAEVVVTLPLVD